MQFQFYKHPFIDLIVENRRIKKHELFAISGIKERPKFNKEFQRLLKEGHIQEDSGLYFPATLSLMVSSKRYDYYIDRIPIKYIPQDELQSVLGYIETGNEPDDSFGFNLFIEHIPITKKHQSFFEAFNDIELDMDLYDYYLSAEYINPSTVNNPRDEFGNKTILFLDSDHIFAERLEKTIKEEFLPLSSWIQFSHPDDALRFLQSKFKANNPVNLIITRIKNIGLNGYEFAKFVLDLEFEYDYFHVPVIALCDDEHDEELARKGLEEKIFSQYFKKTDDIRDIGDGMAELFYSRLCDLYYYDL